MSARVAALRTAKRRHPSEGNVDVLFAVLLLSELLAYVFISWDLPVLGEYYSATSRDLTLVSLGIAILTLYVWRSIALSTVGTHGRRLSGGDYVGIVLSQPFVWVVVVVNYLATLTFGYASVSYEAPPRFAFLISVIPLEPLLLARIAYRRRAEYGLLAAYAMLGLMRGLTGHLLVMFLALVLLARRRQAFLLVGVVLLVAPLGFEVLDALRAYFRGVDELTGSLGARIASRLAMTPIIDYVINNVESVVLCNGGSMVAWYQEIILSVVPKSLLGVVDTTTVHKCLAIVASGDPETEMTFSTTLPVKLLLVWAMGNAAGILYGISIVVFLIFTRRLSSRLLGPGAFLFFAPVTYAFFLSGVTRDIVTPFYFLALLMAETWVIRAIQAVSLRLQRA